MDKIIPKEERIKERRKILIKWGAGVAVGAVALVVSLMSIRKSVRAEDLQIAVADKGTIETSIRAGGKVVPAFEEIINSPIATRILEVYCHEGDSVDVGTPLLRLDLQSAETEINKLRDERLMKQYELKQHRLNDHTYLSNLEMQVKVKEMEVNRKRVEVSNERRLDSLGSGTGDRVREAELAYHTGVLELEQLRKQLSNEREVREAGTKMKALELDIFDKNFAEEMRTLEDARIRSPRRAILTYVNNEIGSRIGQGEKVAVVSDLSHFKIDAEIADSYGDRINTGAKVIVKIGQIKISGRVSGVVPLSKNGVIAFSVALDDDDNERLRSGLRTDVFVMCDIRDDVVRIPAGSYYKGPGDYDMFVQKSENELEKRKIKLGEGSFEYVEVIRGIALGEKVVVSDMSNYNNKNKLVIKR